jgi:very-short-patch-repair endonuclease
MGGARNLDDWLIRAGGVAHSSDLRAAGFSEREMARAISGGGVRRVRRSWLVIDSCDPRRVAAASVSGRITCVSAAALHGLWVPEHNEVHVAVRPNAARFSVGGMRVHWSGGPAPVKRWAIEDPPINVLFHAARCLPRRDALAVWESALRQGIIDRDLLGSVQWTNAKARELAQLASVLSDSGLETVFVDGMRALNVVVRQQVWIDGHRVDGLIGECLVIQLDGFSHHRGADRRRDIRADARLVLLGYTVLRFDFQQVLFDWPYVEDAVVAAMAQGRHLIRGRRNR